MKAKYFKNKDLLIGIFFLLLSGGYYLESLKIVKAGKSAVGPGFLPGVVTVLLAVLSIAMIVNSLRSLKQEIKRDEAKEETEKNAKKANYKTVALTGLLILGFVLFMEPLGFIPTAAAYLFLQFNIAAPKSHKTRKYQVAYVVAAVLIAITINYLFVHGFDVLLPQGILEG